MACGRLQQKDESKQALERSLKLQPEAKFAADAKRLLAEMP
jgi:hypothetical protein